MCRKPRYRRWTADTETAFLMALRVTGSVKRACAEIGRSPSGAYWRRQQVPGFDAKYRQVLDEWQAEQAAERRAALGADETPGVMANRVRFDGFTKLRQRAFLRAISETGNLKKACKRVGISKQAALKARRTYPGFAAAWDRAETHCEADLEQIAIERAIDGIEEQVSVGGQLVTRTVRAERLMIKMIDVRERRAREAARLEEKGLVKRRHVATKEETDAVLIKRLDAMAAHAARKKAAMEARLWAAWQAAWGRFGRDLALARADAEENMSPLDLARREPERWTMPNGPAPAPARSRRGSATA